VALEITRGECFEAIPLAKGSIANDGPNIVGLFLSPIELIAYRTFLKNRRKMEKWRLCPVFQKIVIGLQSAWEIR